MFHIKNPNFININLIKNLNVFQTSEYKQLDTEYNGTLSKIEELWKFDTYEYEMLEMALETTATQIVNLLRQRLAEITNDTSEDANKERNKILQKLKELK